MQVYNQHLQRSSKDLTCSSSSKPFLPSLNLPNLFWYIIPWIGCQCFFSSDDFWLPTNIGAKWFKLLGHTGINSKKLDQEVQCFSLHFALPFNCISEPYLFSVQTFSPLFATLIFLKEKRTTYHIRLPTFRKADGKITPGESDLHVQLVFDLPFGFNTYRTYKSFRGNPTLLHF